MLFRDCTVRTQERYKEQCILCGPLKDHFSTSRMTCMTSTRESFCMSLSFWSTIVSTQATLLSVSLMTAFHADTPTPIDPALLRSGEHKLRQSASDDSPSDWVPCATWWQDSHNRWKVGVVLAAIEDLCYSHVSRVFAWHYCILGGSCSGKTFYFQKALPIYKNYSKTPFYGTLSWSNWDVRPLVHTWTIQHEAKLSFIKRASHSSNFKNVCLTVPQTHQLWLCYQLECLTLFIPNRRLVLSSYM